MSGGLFGGLFGGLGMIGGALIKARMSTPSRVEIDAGNAATAEVTSAASAQVAQTETAVANAEVAAPKTQAAVVDALNKGEF